MSFHNTFGETRQSLGCDYKKGKQIQVISVTTKQDTKGGGHRPNNYIFIVKGMNAGIKNPKRVETFLKTNKRQET